VQKIAPAGRFCLAATRSGALRCASRLNKKERMEKIAQEICIKHETNLILHRDGHPTRLVN